MQTRSKDEKKLSSKLVSPYNVREIVPDATFSADESKLYFWLMTDVNKQTE